MNDLPLTTRQPNIMIIDDTPANLDLLTSMLQQKGYKMRPALSGKLAIQAAKNDPPDLILLDITMPEMSGYEVCEKLKSDKALRDIPIIFISALSETTEKLKAFSLGGVDYITKPFQIEEVHARVTTHLKLRQLRSEVEVYSQKLEELVRVQVKEIFESQMATLFSIVKLAESRDDDTGKHLERVQKICRLLASVLADNSRYAAMISPAYLENIFYASPLHDIGKVAITDNILLKPGKLTQAEFEIMKTHTELGARTLEAVHRKYKKNHFLEMGIEIALYHHEKWNGSGYMSGISGEDIPLSARIMAVVDVYDALRSKRCYKEPVSHENAYQIIMKDSGSHFDPEIVAVFDKIHDQIEVIYDKSML